MPKESYPKIALQLSGSHERNLDQEQSTYISPLYTISDNVGKIDDMLVVTLLENLKELEEFELHLEIQLFDWLNKVAPKKLMFAQSVKEKELFRNTSNYQVETRYLKKISLSRYNELERPLYKKQIVGGQAHYVQID